MTEVLRVSFGVADKNAAFVAARQAFNSLAAAGVHVVQHEHIRLDGRVFVDVVQSAEDQAKRLIRELDLTVPVTYERALWHEVDECPSCGNVAEAPTTVCPACRFREVDRCPHCDREVPRVSYISIAAALVQCPHCGGHASVAFHDPVWDENGHFNQPLVRVRPR